MMAPQITVGIGFYNPGVHFELAIKSVFAQTFTDWELILLDDGSTDGSLEFARRIQDPRVRVYSDGINRGVSIRMNEMIQLVNSPYFFRMDADDILHPQRLEIQYAELLKHGTDTIIGTSMYSIDINSQVFGLNQSPRKQNLDYAARRNLFQPTVAATTAWFQNNPYSNDWVYRRCEDAELWCRASRTSKYINMDVPLVYYREVGNYSLKNQMSTYLGLFNIIREYHFHEPFKFSYLMGKELFRLFLAATITSFGKSHWFIARRFRQLKPAEVLHAEQGLQLVYQQALPLRQPQPQCPIC